MAREIFIYNKIGEGGLSSNRFRHELSRIEGNEPIHVRINSAGGAVSDGLAIYALMLEHPAQMIVHIDGWAASAAGIIAMAGDERIMAKNAAFMLHNVEATSVGLAKDLRASANMLDALEDASTTIYVTRSSLSREEIKAMMDKTTWLTAQDALAAGFATSISAPFEAVAFANQIDVTPELMESLKTPGWANPKTKGKRMNEFLTAMNAVSGFKNLKPKDDGSLPEGAAAAIAMLTSKLAEAEVSAKFVAEIREPLGVAADAGMSVIQGTVLSNSELAKNAVVELNKLKEIHATMEAQMENTRKDELIKQGTADGKLSKSLAEWCKTQTADQIAVFLPVASVIVPLGQTDKSKLPATPLKEDDTLNRVMAACGVTAIVEEPKKQ